MAKKAPYNFNALARGAVRRVFARSPKVRQVLMAGRREIAKYNKDGSRAKKDAVQYHCQVCQDWVGSSYISVDHIVPVISDTVGWIDWNTFFDRLDCDITNLQRICDICHNKKTNEERFKRMFEKERRTIMALQADYVPESELKDFVCKFTPKRLSKFPYPQDFKDTINYYRKRFGLKV